MAVVDRHGAPAQQRLSFFRRDALEDAADALARGAVGWQKHGAGAVLAGLRKVHAGGRRHLAEEAVRHLDQNPRAVARVGFAAARAAVLQVDQNLKSTRDNGVRTPAGNIYDEADATGVVLKGWIVQAASLRRVSVSCRHAPSYGRRLVISKI